MSVDKKILVYRHTGFMVLAVMIFLSFKLLLVNIMSEGISNEIDVLPLAKHYAEQTWISEDWYLNQPPSYRVLFQALFGNLAAAWGFLVTSLVGRLLCYGLVALGLVLISRKLGLSLPLLLLAVVLFLSNQSLVAGEWIVGGLEAKSIAYSLILLALSLMLNGRYLWMALMLGLATSFHVLVGGWAFLAVLIWLLVRPKICLRGIQRLGLILLVYLATSAFALETVAKQLFALTPVDGPLLPSYIYVFMRLPHHLDPLSWSENWWIRPMKFLVVLILSISLLWYQRHSEKLPGQYAARMGLAEFTLISLIPFILGLIIAPFDIQGKLLQYYPFRLGDVMLPLNTLLLFACALEQIISGQARRILVLACIMLLSFNFTQQAVSFKHQLLTLRQFPSVDQEVNPQWKDLCAWVRTHTPQDALVVSSPGEFNNFTWLAERPTIAKFKLLPQSKAGIVAWYNRISDLSGNNSLWLTSARQRAVNMLDISHLLREGYNHLTTAQVEALMTKYEADYFVTQLNHSLALPIVYSNSLYTLYSKLH